MRFRDGIPFIPSGPGPDQNWFCGGRIGVAVGGHGGMTRIAYYGRQHLGGGELFHADPVSAWSKLFRLCVLVDGVPYHPGFQRTELLPCGYRSHASIQGVAVEHDLVLLNDAIVQRVRVRRNPRHRHLALRLVCHGAAVRTGGAHRSWTGFTPLDGTGAWACAADDAVPVAVERRRRQAMARTLTQRFMGGIGGPHTARTLVAVGGSGPVGGMDLHDGFKWHFDGDALDGEGFLFVCFGWEERHLAQRIAELRQGAGAACDAALAAARAWPQVHTRDPATGSFLGQLPAVIDSLRVADVPGGMRAAAGHYWIWGWDSLVYSKGLLFAGHQGLVEEMLAFYQERAHPTLGIPHCFATSLAPTMAMAATAQCLYGVMLANHFAATRDLVVLRRHFPFARRIIETAMEGEVRGTGLIQGPSLFPDYPELVGHDGHDLSVLNNSIFYQALRVMAGLARVLAEADADPSLTAFALRLEDTAERCRQGFRRVFFDEEAGYFVDSASSRDLSQRRIHPAYAILWVSRHAEDLVREDLRRIAGYMRRHLAHPLGVWHYPPAERAAFLSDGNQGSASYPVIEPFYRNIMSLAGDRSGVEGLSRAISWFWRRHTIPEGLTFDAMNASTLTPDCPGGKQPFAGKAWYEAFFTAYAGIDLDLEGLRLRPTPVQEPIDIDGLQVGRFRFQVRIRGSGTRIRASLNGTRLPDPSLILLASLSRIKNRLSITRFG